MTHTGPLDATEPMEEAGVSSRMATHVGRLEVDSGGHEQRGRFFRQVLWGGGTGTAQGVGAGRAEPPLLDPGGHHHGGPCTSGLEFLGFSWWRSVAQLQLDPHVAFVILCVGSALGTMGPSAASVDLPRASPVTQW